MKILFGKHYGKDVSELESSYLLFVIESDFADWTLTQACKKELSARLKLDWTPKSDEQRDLEAALKQSTKQVDKLMKEKDFLFDVLMMSVQCGGNYYTIEGYLNNPGYMYARIRQIKEAQNHN